MDSLKNCFGVSPVFNLTLREIFSILEESKHSLGPPRPTCVIFTLDDGGNSLLKLLKIFFTSTKIRFVSIFISIKYNYTSKSYGIYPTIEQPSLVFEIQSPAEDYVMKNILPEGPDKLVGYLRLIVKKMTKINPILGGVAFMIRANT
jgi:hypothetical protein